MTSTTEIMTNDDGRPADPDGRASRPRRTGLLVAGLVVGLTAVTATTLGVWASAGASGQETPDPGVPAAPAAYQPGGSVYEQQVPDAAPGPETHHSERGGGAFVAGPSC